MTALLTAPTDATPLSVANPGPDGSRAVAQVLGWHGVTVVAADDTASAVAQAGGQATLVIAGPQPVSDRQIDLYAQVDCAVVLIAPDPALRQSLERELPADRLTVAENAAVFTNGGVLAGDNAATALRTLGAHPRLIWNVARWEDDHGVNLEAGGSIWRLLPPWAPAVAVQLGVAATGAALWRGRRFGRVVPEELPVTVPASQITTGLGVLYRRRRAFGHAAAALRAGAAARAGARLGLGWTTEPATLVAAIARAIGQAEGEVRALLYGPAPRSASQLAALAQALDKLEKEVAAA
jgi:hypothetical protein